MVLLEIEQRARRNNSHRVKLFVQILTTTGYASIGGALAEPIFNAATFGLGHVFGLCVGLVCFGWALYLVPEGERHV